MVGNFLKCFNLYLLFSLHTAAQQPDSAEFDYPKIYALALDADISSVLTLLHQPNAKPLTEKSRKLKEHLLKRFGYENDQSDYLETRKSRLDDILRAYRDYWRWSLLNPKSNYDSLLITNLRKLLAEKYALPTPVSRDSLDFYLKKVVSSAGYHTTGFGKTGKLYDLPVWKQQYDTTYVFKIKQETIKAPVVFMDDFLTLGWEEYATLGRNYPGGWATKEALYAVKKAYNLQSEDFLVSYLAHEGKHFSDYRAFPKLSGTDLEYRAKLIELSLARKNLFKIIEFFIKNANAQSSNPHPLANYYVIRDLSKPLFGKDFENDISRWKSVKQKEMNNKAFQLYNKHTEELKKAGAENVTKFIN